jgi:hypothetical protein
MDRHVRSSVRLATATAVLAALFFGAGPSTPAGAAVTDSVTAPGSVIAPDGLGSVTEPSIPPVEASVVTPPEALLDQPASAAATTALDPQAQAALTKSSCSTTTCMKDAPATSPVTSPAGRDIALSNQLQVAAGGLAAAAPTYGPPDCAFTNETHGASTWRFDPNRTLSCRSITRMAIMSSINAQGVVTIVGTEVYNVNEWFQTAYNSLTVTHGVMFEGITADKALATRGITLTAPMPCAPVVAAGQVGCSTTTTGLAVDIPELRAGIARSAQWSETMVLNGPNQTRERLLFGDFLRVRTAHPAANVVTPPYTLSGQDEFRCDNQTNVGNVSGCVDAAFTPSMTFDDSVNADLEAITHHIRLAQDRLPGNPGRPGSTPFVRIHSDSAEARANRARSCDNNTRFRYDGAGTQCDEYPFATAQQSTSSPYSAMPVPAAANGAQAGVISSAILKNRINLEDKYFVVAKPASSRSGSPAKNSSLNTQFATYGDTATCADWSGGDATNSIVVPGTTKRAWFFSDSFLGSPTDRRNLFGVSAVHNSIVIQDAAAMRTITGGNTCEEGNQSLDFFSRYAKAPAESTGGFWWTGDQVAVGSSVVKFYYHGVPTGGAWVNDYAAAASLSAAALSTASTIPITPSKLKCATGGPDAMWGTMVMKWSDTKYYIYGTGASVPHKLYLARAKTAADLTNFAAWEFFTGADLTTAKGSGEIAGTTFVPSCAAAAPLPIGAGASGGSVDFINGTVWLVQDDYVDPNSFSVGTISAHPSQTPWGFTNRRIPFYDPPEGTHNFPYYHWVYEPRIQDGLTAGSSLVLSYNVNTDARNTGCVTANRWDARIYRPRFVNIPLSWLNTYDASYLSTGLYSYPGASPAKAVANNIGGATDWSAGGFGTTGCPFVGPPVGFTATAKTDGTVDMSWGTTGSDIWTYLWQCDSTTTACGTAPDCTFGTAGFTKQFGGLWLTVNALNLAPVQSSAQNGHTFRWYICSSGASSGKGGPSNIVTARATVPVPAAPIGLRLVSWSGTSVNVIWTKVTFPSENVFVTPFYWDITAGGTAANAIALAPQVGGTTMTVTVPNATHTYGFYLKASNLSGSGPASNQIQG